MSKIDVALSNCSHIGPLRDQTKIIFILVFFQFHSRGTGRRFKTLCIEIDKLLRPHRGFEKIRPDLALSEYPTWACSGKVELMATFDF